MNRLKKIVKYQVYDSVKAMSGFYIIIILIGLFMTTISVNSNGKIENVRGIGIASTVFIFSIALSSFRSNFLFMQANNISRKSFFISMGIAWIVISGLLAILEVIFNQLFTILIPYKGVYEQLYNRNSVIEDFMWCFAMFAFTASIGWIITLIYYRSSKLMRVVVSLSPLLLIVLLGMIDNKLGGNVIGKFFEDFSRNMLGFSDQYSSYSAALWFWFMAVVVYALSYLLLRRAPIK